MIVYDVSWNPSYDEQAQDRAYRIGQKRNVEVIRLVSRGTIEELMVSRSPSCYYNHFIVPCGTYPISFYTSHTRANPLVFLHNQYARQLYKIHLSTLTLGGDSGAQPARMFNGVAGDKNRKVSFTPT